MPFHSEDQVQASNAGPTQAAMAGPNSHERSIQACNFRAAGRISNENARLLTEIHEAFAHRLANAMDAYLGTGIEVKLQSLEQSAIKDYIAGIVPFSYLASATFNTSPGSVFIHCNVDIVFPIIDLLLGEFGNRSIARGNVAIFR